MGLYDDPLIVPGFQNFRFISRLVGLFSGALSIRSGFGDILGGRGVSFPDCGEL